MRAYRTLAAQLEEYVAERGLAWPEKATIEPPKDKKFGDLATNLAMVLAKQAKKSPREIATELSEHVQSRSEAISEVQVAGPGFVNVFFTPAFWQQTVLDVKAGGEKYGRTDLGRGKRVQVEYVSANPTGPLHIGHGRGAAVGDSLTRILRAAGFEVDTEYYINDAGRQMRLLGLSVLTRMRRIVGQDVELPEDCYKGEYIRDIAARLLDERGEDIFELPEEELIAACRDQAVTEILAGIREDLAEFRVEHQVWFSEKELVASGAVQKTFDRLHERGLTYEADGALWFKATEFGDEKDRVLRKSDGGLTYFASDIAYHDNKYDRGFELVVNVWGADHHGYVPRMKGAVQALGREPDDLEVILVQLVSLLRSGDQVAMSTRAGKFETLADVIAEVGTDPARFIFLSRKSDSHLEFDLDLVKQQTMENPVYYVQYAHARICSVMRKAEERNVSAGNVTPELLQNLDTPEDIALLKQLEQFPDLVRAAAANLSPHLVSFYLSDLAKTLHRYYTVHQVLAAENDELVRARMWLMDSVARVLKNGLTLIGVEAPERM
jgi:arginyl-tRNA synthetase